MIAVQTDSMSSIFYTKSLGNSAKASAAKGKTVKKECIVRLASASDEFISAQLINETNISYIHGSVFGIKKSQVKLLDDAGKVQKDIVLQSNEASEKKEKNDKKEVDQYQVMGIEEEGNARVNAVMARQLVPQTLQLSLFEDDDNLESRLTSVSSKNVKVTKSLGTVLTQALTADDTETLDWVLSNREDAVISNTLISLKDHKLISSLFKQIIIKFQSQDVAKQSGVLLWLKSLISLHWLTIIKKADKEDLA